LGSLTLENIRKSFGKVDVLKGIDLDVKDGEFVTFVGPSGCGKSTLLRVIAGLEDATGGSVRIDGEEVGTVPPAKRGIAMVFQSYALYPHLNVRDNMGLGLKQAGTPKGEIEARVKTATALLSLDDYLERRPAELSGGQRPRVAIGRAIVRKPKLFLFDEPLSNLDAALRVNTRLEIARLHRELKATMIYVTHDQVEAMTMGHRVAVMRKGQLQQVAPPEELYQRPVNMFVGGFIGSPPMNMLAATVERGNGALAVVTGDARIELPDDLLVTHGELASYEGREVVLGIRPESLEDASLADANAPRLAGLATLREALGAEVLVHFTVAGRPAVTSEVRELAEDVGDDRALEQLGSGSPRATVVGRFSPRTRIREGDQLEAAVDPHALHFFDPASGRAIDGSARGV
jgi:multiple sugar transport system ATP-binding protein